MCPGDMWGWRSLWWGFTWRYSIINQGLTMAPRLRSHHLPANPTGPLEPHSHPIAPPSPSPSPSPTWSHAEASDDADHAGHADIAHPGQGSLQGDTGTRGWGCCHTQQPWDTSPCPPSARWWLLGTVATQHILVRCR